jgi:uncharacterized membrane protein
VALADLWVDAFGQLEPMARGLSSLLTALTLALMFRLGSDLFGYGVGLAAVFLLGTSPFFQFYGHEFRPYAALTLCAVGMQWSFLRWLRQPDFRQALLFVGFGIAGIYVHFFAFYVLAALALFLLVFVRWSPRLYLRAFGLFLAIGLSYLGWLLPFAHAVLVTNPGGIRYALETTWELVGRLYSRMAFRPHEVSAFLFLTALLLPVAVRTGSHMLPADDRFRLRFDWRRWYPLFIPTTVFLLALLLNLIMASLTQRSLLIMLPSVAVFLAYGFMALPRAARLALVIVIVPVTFNFLDFEITGPQAEIGQYISEFYQQGSPIIMNVPMAPRQIALNYYIQERMDRRVPSDRLWQIYEPDQPWLDFLPAPPEHVMYDVDIDSLRRLEQFLDDASQVIYVERDQGTRFSTPILGILEQEYAAVNDFTWRREYRVIEFRRSGAADD